MKTKFIFVSALCLVSLSFTACSDDESDILPEPPEYERQEQPTKGAYILTLEGKVDDGTTDGEFANMVYVDLSEEEQLPVSRFSWHLSFYSGNESRVTLNQSLSRVYTTGKTDFEAVTLEDVKNAVAEMKFPDLAGGMMGYPKEEQINDTPDGDLATTAFGDLSTDPAKTEVYLLASEALDVAQWYKVKITSLGNAYHIAYCNISDNTPQEATIQKDANNLFVPFSLKTGKIVDLPKTWDLMWSKSIALTQMPNGKIILGPSSDVVTTNRHSGVEVAQVPVQNPLEIRTEFENFTKTATEGLEFKQEADILGTDWRMTPMPNAVAPGPKADRFYVIKDASGNLFKLRFLHFCEEDGGERGKPMLEAAPL